MRHESVPLISSHQNRLSGFEPMTKTAALGALTYVAIAEVTFGGVLKPLEFATRWSDRLGAPHWLWIVLACFAVATCSYFIPARFSIVRGPVFVAVGLGGSLILVGAYADHLRIEATREFSPSQQFQHSFFESIRNAPEEYQFFLHAGVMKNCIPYAWSYRTMNFYRIPQSAAPNVMPITWLAACSKHSGTARSK